jgi:hypothetical protein
METRDEYPMKILILTGLLVMLFLAGCGSDDVATVPTATPDDTPVEILNIGSLREQADSLDGQVVTVRSNYWSDGDRQYLSDIMMESYPPQIPFDQAVILDGEMPESVMDMLTHADDAFSPVIWGEVDITGQVRVEGDEVHLEIHEAFAVQT